MTDHSDVSISSRLTELEIKSARSQERQAQTEATIEQMNKSIAAGNRMTNWQFIGFVVVMAGTLFGTLYWATGVLERRLDQMERQINIRFDDTNKKYDQRFDDMNRRFEDLRQVVLSERKR